MDSDSENKKLDAVIERMRTEDEARLCATLMVMSEPWITLRRDFDHALEMLLDPAKEVYIARVEDKFTGHIVVNMQGPFTGYIQAIAVAPEWRSRGIGAKLIRFAEERIFCESPNVFLCVTSFNLRAQAFYERLGYERIGELKDFIIRGASEFLMRKSIGPRAEFQRKR